MTNTIDAGKIRDAVKLLMSETFDDANGIYLDKGDSLWATLENVTAGQASIPIAPGHNSIAGQVNHLIYYFDLATIFMTGDTPEDVDWAEAWKTVAVNEEEWSDLRHALRQKQKEVLRLIDTTPEEMFSDPNVLGGSYGVIAHSAFHLGQIRHALAAQGL